MITPITAVLRVKYTLGKSILRNKCVDYTWAEAQSLADEIMLEALEALHFLYRNLNII